MIRPAVSLILAIAPLFIGPDIPWNKSKSGSGVVVFTRAVPGSPIKEIKADLELACSLNTAVACLSDISLYPQWIYQMTEARIISKVSPTDFTVYQKISTPWPLDDRDVCGHYTIKQNPVSKDIVMETHAVPLFDAQSRVTAMLAPVFAAADLKTAVQDLLPLNAAVPVQVREGDYVRIGDGRWLHLDFSSLWSFCTLLQTLGDELHEPSYNQGGSSNDEHHGEHGRGDCLLRVLLESIDSHGKDLVAWCVEYQRHRELTTQDDAHDEPAVKETGHHQFDYDCRERAEP